MATGDFGSGRMPPDMFYNYNEEIKRKKELTIRSRNRLISRGRDRGRDGARGLERIGLGIDRLVGGLIWA